MASFLSGPAAHLLGAGMQAVGVGIPVGETSAKLIEGLRNCGMPVPPKTWFKSKDNNASKERQAERDERSSNKTVYDKLETHINGVLQVVRPAIELKKLVRDNCCKSAERPRRASPQSPRDNLRYYTPQKCSSNACNLFERDRSPSPKRKVAKKSGKCERRRCARRRDSSSEDEEHCCTYCSRTRSLIKLPCGRLICVKCDETGDHELELNMPRVKTRPSRSPMPNPVDVIDLTQDSPANASFRLSRVQRRRDEESDCESDDNEIVIPLDDSTEDSDIDMEVLRTQRPKKKAVVVNLEETIHIDEKPSEMPSAKQQATVVNEASKKKESLSCPICFESLADENMTPMSTPCGHLYCLDCLKKVTQAKKKCALCQRTISLGKCIRLHI